MDQQSNRSPRPCKSADKPEKPYPTFPLTPHASGAWQKKILGKIHYFGRWANRVNGKLVRIEDDGWKDALEIFNERAEEAYTGRKSRPNANTLTVADLCGQFLDAKELKLNSGEITPRTFAEYKATTDMLVKRFGQKRLVDDLASDDFEKLRDAMAKSWGPVRLAITIQKVRTVFKYGFEAGLIEKPVRYGPEFVKPSRSVLRKHRAAGGKRLFDSAEVKRLVESAGVPLKAMILLAINCGFGNGDCGTLPISALDLKAGWIRFPRPKTGIERRCPLWPETVKALTAAIKARPEPKESSNAGLVFITKYGAPWWDETNASAAITLQFGKLLRTLEIKRPGLNFYALRHTFRTIADAKLDGPAVRLIMGHADESIDATYREVIDDARLAAVVKHVRSWLWPKAKGTRSAKQRGPALRVVG